MLLTRPYNFSQRTHILALPAMYLLIAGLIYSGLYSFSQGGFIRGELPNLQIVGTLILFVIMPSYFITMMSWQWQRTESALSELKPIAKNRDLIAVRSKLEKTTSFIWLFLICGFLFGLSQNISFVAQIINNVSLASALDIAFVLGNCLIWCIVTLLLCWRLPVAVALSNLGKNLDVDLYRMDKIQPIANVAIIDVLVIGGALAMQPLQALDAEFRIWNFQAGFMIGIPAAFLLFLVPLVGIRRNIIETKQQRIDQLQQQLANTKQHDIGTLELLSSHMDRLQALPNWPVNLKVLTRVLAYVILPPLAWVGAALVENLVDAF